MKRAYILALAVLGIGLVSVVVACVSQQQGSGVVAQSLTGNWQVISLGDAALPDEASVTLDFATDRVSGRSGCNRYNGAFSQNGESVTFGPTAMTRMACPPPLMEMETQFTKALAGTTGFLISEDGTLLLYSGGGVVMRARPE